MDLFPSPRKSKTSSAESPASFRALYSMKAQDRDSVLASGLLAVQVAEALASRYRLPPCDIPDFGVDGGRLPTPAAAAEMVRSSWQLGTGPIDNMVHLLESKGVRVFWLARDLHEVDAFSFWRGGVPYVVLNTMKSGERGRFDAAHELGHLVLHRNGDAVGRKAEKEAHAFAASFLLPAERFKKDCPSAPIFKYLLALKPKWKVSMAAMVKRGQDLKLFTEWQTKSAWIEMSKRGMRRKEPGELRHEESLVFEQIARRMAKNRQTLGELAAELHIPSSDFWELIPLARALQEPPKAEPRSGGRKRGTHLRLVRSTD